MSKPKLRVLIVEDSEEDALLLVRHLKKTYSLVQMRVDHADDLRAALRLAEWDIVLSDHAMPGFSSFGALQIVQQYNSNLPFLIISGAIGENQAAAAITAGARDYLLKDQLEQLVPTIERELRAAQAQRDHAQFDQRFGNLSAVVAHIADIICITNRNGVIEYANAAFELHTGYSAAEVLGKTHAILKSGHQDGAFYQKLWHTILAGDVFRGLFVNRKKNGELYYEEKTIAPLRNARGELTHFISSGRDVTEREHVEQRFRSTFNQAAVGIGHLALDGHWIRVNQKLCDITGYTEDEFMELDFDDITHPDDSNIDPDRLWQMLTGEISSFVAEKRYIRKDGAQVWVSLTMSLAYTPAGEPDYIIAVTEDITARKEAADNLRLFARIFESVNEGIMVMDTGQNIRFVNPAFSMITGYNAAESVGESPRFLHSGLMDESFYQEMWHTIGKFGHWQGEMINRRKNGENYVEWHSINALKDEHGEISHYIAVFSDISERKSVEERMAYMAQHDFLTGLPNRLMLQDRLAQAIAHAEREQHKVGIMFLDLDHFKSINDTLGHQIGDKLLQGVAGRIRSVARTSDTVSRQGGDEFVVMLPNLESVNDVAMVATKLLEAVAVPCVIEGNELDVTTSIGISVFPEDGLDGDSLLKHADAAMYHAKKNGRNNYQFFTNEMNLRALQHMSIENKLRHALERDEFFLDYQPQVDLRSGCIIGAEALLRWKNPDAGMISPAQFIHIAEDNGLILPIGEWVLRQACRQNQHWRKMGLPKITMAVNLSAVQFRQKDLGAMINGILCESCLDSSGLELEITERAVMHDADTSISNLRKLKDLGVTVAMDDFGTGYSSLFHLKRLPIDKLKIDQSFVRDLTSDPDDAAIVNTIISMAHNLNLKVIAEGVETSEQLAFLRAMDEGDMTERFIFRQHYQCDEMQGYYFSKPVTPDQFAHLSTSRLAN